MMRNRTPAEAPNAMALNREDFEELRAMIIEAHEQYYTRGAPEIFLPDWLKEDIAEARKPRLV